MLTFINEYMYLTDNKKCMFYAFSFHLWPVWYLVISWWILRSEVSCMIYIHTSRYIATQYPSSCKNNIGIISTYRKYLKWTKWPLRLPWFLNKVNAFLSLISKPPSIFYILILLIYQDRSCIISVLHLTI